MEGWIKIHRKLLEWEWADDNLLLAFWIRLLFRANYKDKEWHGIKIKRGQMITGRKRLAIETGFSERQVRTFLKRLKSTSEVTIETTNQFSLITINNYELYQTNGIQTTSKVTSETPTNDQQTTTTKERKEVKELKKNKSSDFLGVYDEYKKMRQRIRKPMTDRAEVLVLRKLNKMAGSEIEQMAILEQSIINSWAGVFDIKRDDKQPKETAGRIRVDDSPEAIAEHKRLKEYYDRQRKAAEHR